MYRKMTIRCVGFFVLLFILICISIYLIQLEYAQIGCLGIPVLSKEEAQKYDTYAYYDLSDELLFFNHPAAVDISSSLIYIPQKVSKYTAETGLKGKLQLLNSDYKLYFLPDDRFEDFQQAVRDGHIFRLLAVNERQEYMEYGVIFTTLPVIKMNGNFSYINDDQRDVMKGEICVWTPIDPDSGKYSVKNHCLEWHVRGATASEQDKKPWKISLKNEKGENENEAYMGFDSDDDWILNPMSMDDSKVRERLFMDLWNEASYRYRYNDRMSEGAYTEVIINGEYMGIYMIQRRVDQKYLGLKHEDILFRGIRLLETPETVKDAYEIKYSPYEENFTYSLIQGTYQGDDLSIVDVDSFIDLNLFIQFASAYDNLGYNNIYVIIKRDSHQFSLRFVPWDTDMSFGNKAFSINVDETSKEYIKRFETYNLGRLHSDLDIKTAKRWKKLRKDMFNEEHIQVCLDKYFEEMNAGGSYVRDKEKWGKFYKGMDSIDVVKDFIKKRLLWMDEYYAQYN